MSAGKNDDAGNAREAGEQCAAVTGRFFFGPSAAEENIAIALSKAAHTKASVAKRELADTHD